MPVLDTLRVIKRAVTRFSVSLWLFGGCCPVLLLTDLPSNHGRSADDPARPVSLYISVLDRDGKPVREVTTKDLTVLEETKPQVITALQFEKDTPVSLGVLVDVSRSMGGEGINLALNWFKTVAETLKSPDEIFVNAFSDESQEVVASV